MSGFIEGEDRTQATLFPERIDDYIAEENAVRVIDVFVDELDLSGLGFKIIPELTEAHWQDLAGPQGEDREQGGRVQEVLLGIHGSVARRGYSRSHSGTDRNSLAGSGRTTR